MPVSSFSSLSNFGSPPDDEIIVVTGIRPGSSGGVQLDIQDPTQNIPYGGELMQVQHTGTIAELAATLLPQMLAEIGAAFSADGVNAPKLSFDPKGKSVMELPDGRRLYFENDTKYGETFVVWIDDMDKDTYPDARMVFVAVEGHPGQYEKHFDADMDGIGVYVGDWTAPTTHGDIGSDVGHTQLALFEAPITGSVWDVFITT